MFTVCQDPGKPIEADLIFRIPHQRRETILHQLNKLKINRRTLFPDLDGISEYVRWACTYWDSADGIAKQADPLKNT